MGTNYYCALDSVEIMDIVIHHKEKIFSDFQKEKDEQTRWFHIGKSSSGWCFTMHVIPEYFIKTWEDWKDFLVGREIVDEYGRKIEFKELKKTVEERGRPESIGESNWYLDNYYKNLEDFLKKNYAILGPKNLLRYKISDFCIGHGEGTWDYIVGVFS